MRISLDDFGTGYSSLSYLRSFPFDKIKVDRAFVSDLADGTEHVVIVQAVVSIARALGMTTTAEGVETEDQQQFLAALGCDEVQGYLFSAPVPIEKVPELIAKWAVAEDHGGLAHGSMRRSAAILSLCIWKTRGVGSAACSCASALRRASCQSRNKPDATTIAEPTSSPIVGTSPQTTNPITSAQTSMR